MTTIRFEQVQTGAVGQNTSAAPMRACEPCHRKKTKCDMGRPVCGLCQRTGSDCHFPSRRKPPARPPKRQRTNSMGEEGNLTWLYNLMGNLDSTQLPIITEPSQQTNLQEPGPNLVGDATTPDDAFITEKIPGHFTAGFPGDAFDFAPELEIPPSPDQRVDDPVPYTLAMDLVETFFSHIQPWLPALHKPRFMKRCALEFQQGPDALRNLSLEMKLLVYSMFALAARFSSSPLLASVTPLTRHVVFISAAHRAYVSLRYTVDSNLTYLQGCILLAFHGYTTELNTKAWILTGICVRLAYDLSLSEIDDDASETRQELDPVVVEEMRRSWWLVWELDTFGSMITRRPFTVDRHHFTVNLPISDEDWFNERLVRSSPLVTSPVDSWTSLRGSDNQNPRAWFLIANHMLSLLFKHLHRKRTSFKDNFTTFEAAFNCLKLSLPSSFRILVHPPSFGTDNFAHCNWIMGTHLMLTSAYSLLDALQANEADTPSPLSVLSQSVNGRTSLRVVGLTQLMTRWPVEFMVAAHPFFVCALLPTSAETTTSIQPYEAKNTLSGVEQMVELVLSCFSERWNLGGEALGTSPVQHLSHRTVLLIRNLAVLHELSGTASIKNFSNSDNAPLRRRFASYFPRKAGVDHRQESTEAHVQQSTHSEMSDQRFDGPANFASPNDHGVTGDTEHRQTASASAITGDKENLNEIDFILTPSLSLTDIMREEETPGTHFQIFS